MELQAESDTFLRSIVRIERVPEEYRVNEALRLGWTLLATATERDGNVRYVIGWSSDKGDIQSRSGLQIATEHSARIVTAWQEQTRLDEAEFGVSESVTS